MNMIQRRLAAIEALVHKTSASVRRGAVVFPMHDGRWYGGGSIHETKEEACAVSGPVTVIVTRPPTPGSVLAAAVAMEAGPDVLEELFPASESLPSAQEGLNA